MQTRRTLAQSIAASLVEAIQLGEFAPGDRLPPERDLMERYEAGRNTVREAVQALVAQGILDVRPGRGTTVLKSEFSALVDTTAALDGAARERRIPVIATEGITPIHRANVPLAVAAQLQELLAAGQFTPGDKLPSERVLGEQFGVGRTSIREALRRLEVQGLVEIRHGIGTIVIEPTDDDGAAHDSELLLLDGITVPELLEVRRGLEREAARLAASRMTGGDRRRIKDLLARLEDGSLTDEEFIDADVEFHQAIAEMSRNNLLHRMVHQLKNEHRAYSMKVIQLPGRRANANQDHHAIADALVSGDPDAAEEAITRHLSMVHDEIATALDL